MDRSGNVVISNSNPSLILSNNAHKFTFNTTDGFNLDFAQDGSTKATLNNSANWNITTVSFVGGQLIYKEGTGTNGISAGSTPIPTGSITTSNANFLGRMFLSGTNQTTPVSGPGIMGMTFQTDGTNLFGIFQNSAGVKLTNKFVMLGWP